MATSELPTALELIWQYAVKDGAFEATPVIADGVVYIGDLDGNIYALDLQNGTERWKKKLDTGFTSAAAIRDKQLFLGDIDGRLHGLDAATGEVQWTFETEGEISSGREFLRRQCAGRIAGRGAVLRGRQERQVALEVLDRKPDPVYAHRGGEPRVRRRL